MAVGEGGTVPPSAPSMPFLFRALRISLLATAAAVLLLAVAAVAEVDEESTGGTQLRDPYYPSHVYQSFTNDATRLTSVELDLYFADNCYGGPPIALAIRESADPNAPVLTSFDGYGPSSGGQGWSLYDFPDVSVAPGKTLYLHFDYSEMYGPWQCAGPLVRFSTSGSYARGAMSTGAGHDLNFRLHGSYTERTLVNNEFATSYIESSADARYFRIDVPAGRPRLDVVLEPQSTGHNQDLYLRQGARPTTATNTCARTGAPLTCTITNPAAGTWYAMVRGPDNTAPGSFRVGAVYAAPANNPPHEPTGPSPSDRGTNVPIRVLAHWTASDPDSDTVTSTAYLSSSSTFSWVDRYCELDPGVTSCWFDGLAYGQTYYWIVRADDGRGGTADSDVWEFTTQAPPDQSPETPHSPSPRLYQGNVPTTVTLSWESVGDPEGQATTYTVEGSTDYSNLQHLCTVTHPARTCSWPALPNDQTHYWKVTASAGGQSSESPLWVFYTVAAHQPVAQFTAQPSGLTAAFDASGSYDPDGSSISSYSWAFGNGQTGSGQTTSHTYPCVGPYEVTLTIQTLSGKQASASRTVSLEDASDGDGDGLLACREAQQSTSDGDTDSDDDGLSDLVESEWWDQATSRSRRMSVFCNGQFQCPEAPDPVRRDLYVEIDWMTGQDLRAAERDLVTSAFAGAHLNGDASAANDIRLHLDTGAGGEGGTRLSFDEWTTNTEFGQFKHDTAGFDQDRLHVYRYGVFGCRWASDRTAGGTTFGIGETPGEFYMVFNCAEHVADAGGQAKEIMHEMGHTLLGYNVANAGPCPAAYAERHNTGLGHFHSLTGGKMCDATGVADCTPAAAADCDMFTHTDDPDDAMISGGPVAKRFADYTDETWSAIKLDFGIDGSVINDCSTTYAESTGSAGVPDATQPLCSVGGAVSQACTELSGGQADCEEPEGNLCPAGSAGVRPLCAGTDAPAVCRGRSYGVEPYCVILPERCGSGETGAAPACVRASCPPDEFGAEPLCTDPCDLLSPSIFAASAAALPCGNDPTLCSEPEEVGVEPTCIDYCDFGTLTAQMAAALPCGIDPTLCTGEEEVGVEPTCISYCPGSIFAQTAAALPCGIDPTLCTGEEEVGVEPTCISYCPGSIFAQTAAALPCGITVPPVPKVCQSPTVGLQPNCFDPCVSIFSTQAAGLPCGIDPTLCTGEEEVGVEPTCISYCPGSIFAQTAAALPCGITVPGVPKACQAPTIGLQPNCFDPCVSIFSTQAAGLPCGITVPGVPRACQAPTIGLQPNCIDPCNVNFSSVTLVQQAGADGVTSTVQAWVEPVQGSAAAACIGGACPKGSFGVQPYCLTVTALMQAARQQ